MNGAYVSRKGEACMFQLGLVRFALNFAFGLLSNLRTLIWLAGVLIVLSYGYLVATNGLDVVAAFEVIAGYIQELWAWSKGTYTEIRAGIASFV
mgnify:CR=1 FL=1